MQYSSIGWAIKWHNKIGVILGAIMVNLVGYLSGPLKQVGFWM